MVATTGNTLGAPPRQSGDRERDTLALLAWVQDLYQAVVLEANVLGTQAQQAQTIAALTERLVTAEGKLAAIAALPGLVGPIAATYTPQQLADAYDKINAIIAGAAQ